LLKAIERPELGADPRFATTPARRANAARCADLRQGLRGAAVASGERS